MIIVYLNNKLISIDTILPLLLELHAKKDRKKILLICFEQATFNAIQRNTILWRCIQQIGTLRLLDPTPRNRVLRRMVLMFELLRLAVTTAIFKPTAIHFKALNTWPFMALYKINKNRTFVFQSSPAPATKREKDVGLSRGKVRNVPCIEQRGAAIIYFQEDEFYLHNAKSEHVPKIKILPPFRREIWNNYLDELAAKELAKIGVGSDQRVFTYILSSMDHNEVTRDPDGFPNLFEETLTVLHESAPDVPVLIKPHPATNADMIALQNEILARTPHRHVIVTQLHPMLLAQVSMAFLANVYSTTFATAVYLGCPTIEYTDYCQDVLTVCGDNSMRPDLVQHFINRKPDQLMAALKEIRELDDKLEDRGLDFGADPVYDDVLDLLAGKKRLDHLIAKYASACNLSR